MTTLAESDVEQAALDWLAELGWHVTHGLDMTGDVQGALRVSLSQVVLDAPLHNAFARLNPALPPDALEDAYRDLTQPEGSTSEARNREFHRMLVDGVTVEYRDDEGRIRGAQAQVIDFDFPSANHFLAVNQFTVTEDNNRRVRTSCCSLTACRLASSS